MATGPKRKDRHHHSYDEGADEPPSLIDKEEADVETENQIDETEPIEQVEEEENNAPPMFEE
ncbi:MAG: hypothetical protein KGL35_29770 [Bradyrhizobium sp.]|uniref:hypothetical protein n=1 Tax=Bradyrhizobium sp. TaxID=376 RepID=UPI001C2A3F76|nr:hypothetical protein [Bradyrhizobium sp.]MBU6461359.1 hypothetical protein [Pseudomonadota bacterium]MDE2066535.1 hypothetical protein [Bradyrhizobium sp.]MDE2472798.1 hypothetical protein [Bradyrhizobium sp.]